MSDIVERLIDWDDPCWSHLPKGFLIDIRDARLEIIKLRAAKNTEIAHLRAEVERLTGIEELYKAGCAAWNPVFKVVLDERDTLRTEIERLRAALREIAKTTYGYELGMPDEEAKHYFSSRFFGAQNTARAALEEKP